MSAAAPAIARSFFSRRAGGVRVSGDPAPPCYSGLGGAGRSRRLEGAGGEGRPERVGDTRRGRRRRSSRTPPWEETGQVWLGAGCQRGGDLRPTNQHQHPAATQLLCALAALRATALPPAPLPARRRRRRPTSAPCGRDGPGGQESPRDTSAFPTAVPGFGLSFKALRLLPAGCPRLCLGAERLSECLSK